MKVKELRLKRAKLLIPDVFRDGRGWFAETYQVNRYHEAGIECEFVQDNHSYSTHGVIRGMHFQSFPGQAKLVRVAVGKIYDVIVDIRFDSPTFGEWEGVYLDDETRQMLFVPVGFAHGFCVVSKEAHVLYKVSTFYHKEKEKGFRYDDPKVGIRWPIEKPILSEKDLAAPPLEEVKW